MNDKRGAAGDGPVAPALHHCHYCKKEVPTGHLCEWFYPHITDPGYFRHQQVMNELVEIKRILSAIEGKL